MSSKAELNERNAHLESQLKYAVVRFDTVMAKNRKLNERLARRRNGFWRRIRLRAKGIFHA